MIFYVEFTKKIIFSLFTLGFSFENSCHGTSFETGEDVTY